MAIWPVGKCNRMQISSLLFTPRSRVCSEYLPLPLHMLWRSSSQHGYGAFQQLPSGWVRTLCLLALLLALLRPLLWQLLCFCLCCTVWLSKDCVTCWLPCRLCFDTSLWCGILQRLGPITCCFPGGSCPFRPLLAGWQTLRCARRRLRLHGILLWKLVKRRLAASGCCRRCALRLGALCLKLAPGRPQDARLPLLLLGLRSCCVCTRQQGSEEVVLVTIWCTYRTAIMHLCQILSCTPGPHTHTSRQAEHTPLEGGTDMCLHSVPLTEHSDKVRYPC